MKPPKSIETARLRLRVPCMEDAEDIFYKYAQDEEVTRYVVWSPHESISVTNEFLQRCIQSWGEGTAYPWAIELKTENELIGMLELRIDKHQADLGFVIARSYWNQGYATEAIKAVVDWALQQASVYRVWAVCDVDNKRSARVMEKANMQKEGILFRFIIHPNISNEPRDCFCYAIVK